MKRILLIILAANIIFSLLPVRAETLESTDLDMFVDGTAVTEENLVIESDGQIYIKLKSLLEAMGSAVREDDKSGEIYFDYDNIEYICQLRTANPYPKFPEKIELCVGPSWIKEFDEGEQLLGMFRLSDDSIGGQYLIESGSLYISYDACYHLLYNLGCGIKMNSEDGNIDILLNKENRGEVFINDEKVNIGEDIIMMADDRYSYNLMYIPFRAIFEAMGSTVQWDSESGDIFFDYAEEIYVCIKILDGEFLVCREKDRWKDENDPHKYLEFGTFSPTLWYEIIDGRTYVTYYEFQGLLRAIGCKAEISMGERTVKIWTE